MYRAAEIAKGEKLKDYRLVINNGEKAGQSVFPPAPPYSGRSIFWLATGIKEKIRNPKHENSKTNVQILIIKCSKKKDNSKFGIRELFFYRKSIGSSG